MKSLFSLLVTLLLVITSGLAPADVILAGRAVEIRIQGVPVEEQGRINGTYPVSEEGKVRMPDVGEVQISGLKAHDAAAKLDAAYKKAGVYTNPTFQVIATMDGKGLRQDVVTMSGFVRNPGQVGFVPGLTIFQAIAAAGGPTEFGSMKRVILMRGKSATTHNLDVIANRNFKLERGDTIEVPNKPLIGK